MIKYNQDTSEYNRKAVVTYARKWALSRNPEYYDYEEIGGDCTNFASQCIYAGSLVMNYKRTFGWYYISANEHSPSWTGVPYLYDFLVRESGIGPIGVEVPMHKIQPGDIVQLAGTASRFTHTLVVVSVGIRPSLRNILICTHTEDSLDRPVSTYQFQRIRFVHITGVNK